MSKISLKDIRVSTKHLELKNNSNNNLQQLLTKLQVNSPTRALVVEVIDQDIIFQTKYGQFICPNNFNFKKGDYFTIILNDARRYIKDLTFEKTYNLGQEQVTIAEKIHDQIRLSENMPDKISGTFSYVDPEKLPNKFLFDLFSNILGQKSKLNAQLQIARATNNNNVQFSGIVLESGKDGSLIKTDFGIFNSEEQLIKGANLKLEFLMLAGKMIRTNLSEDFLTLAQNIQNNWSLLKQMQLIRNLTVNNTLNHNFLIDQNFSPTLSDPTLIDNVASLYQQISSFNLLKAIRRNTRNLKYDIEINHPDKKKLFDSKGVSNTNILLKENSNLKNFKMISAEFKRIISEFYSNPVDPQVQNQYKISLPLYDGYDLVEQKFEIKSEQDRATNFSIEIETNQYGTVSLSGHIQYNHLTNMVKKFDLNIESHNIFNSYLKELIRIIFYNNIKTLPAEGELSFTLKNMNE